MLKALSRPLVRIAERWLPSALTFAVILTLVVALLALTMTDSGPVEVTRAWGDGLIGLLEFMTQISLVLLLGHMLAHTAPVRRLLTRAAAVPKTPAQAYGFVALCAAVASLITWGLGLVVAALMSIEVAKSGRARGLRLHFPLLVASGYSGYVVWHMGYSGSGPLAAATPGSFVEEQVGSTIPVTDTIFTWWNITGAVVAVVVVVLAMAALAPDRDEPVVELPADAHTEEAGPRDLVDTGGSGRTPAERLDGSRLVTTVLGLALLGYLATYYAQEGFALTLDIVNWTFLCLIMLLVSSPAELGRLVVEAARNVGDILLQFPLYAGILGIMATTGLITIFAEFFTQSDLQFLIVEPRGLEPLTPCLQSGVIATITPGRYPSDLRILWSRVDISVRPSGTDLAPLGLVWHHREGWQAWRAGQQREVSARSTRAHAASGTPARAAAAGLTRSRARRPCAVGATAAGRPASPHPTERRSPRPRRSGRRSMRRSGSRPSGH